ncbi:MAG: potassium-transporting ATPase subunit KdpC [Paludisphaera borealis]|uniref:potassium-transporting ATPase subunit KdpC n=1 Tax=Paludisphaera borealis TaxID=1387353 RepID=UPI00284C3694|nr:potassium-transporting ATPase subunit KdpC [Paludisphaera borealis]MDR3619403.1 potassium-transporting ATPase subunit KdpC [Paludisphaera borealis]
MKAQLRPALTTFILLTVVTGVAYPLIVSAIAQTLFADRANGSLIVRDGVVVGSEFVGQPFDDPRYFWSRPSAAGPNGYDGVASSGSNLGPTNPALAEAVSQRIATLRKSDPESKRPVPIDLVTASASGLDPDLSPAAVEFQVERVARERNLPVEQVRGLVAQHVLGRSSGLMGEARVNVLKLNLALDGLGRGSDPVR